MRNVFNFVLHGQNIPTQKWVKYVKLFIYRVYGSCETFVLFIISQFL
jgi:hypothetical protein